MNRLTNCCRIPRNNAPPMQYKLIVLLILLSAGLGSYGQADSTFGEFEKEMQQEFDAFTRQNQIEFDNYVEEIDKEFSDYLRENWVEFRLFAGIKPDTTPKPLTLPIFDPSIRKVKPGEIPREIPVQPLKGITAPVLQPVPNLPLVIKSEPETPLIEPEGTILDFYGARLSIHYDPGLAGELPTEIHNTDIANFWDRINQANYSGLIRTLKDYRTLMNLNDWGYYMLVKKTAELISPSKNYSRLLSWFLLTKSGYRVRVAYAENQIALMFPSSNTIFGLRYFVIDQVKFYAPEFTPNQIYTYEQDFPGATGVFDLNVYNALNIGDQFAERTFNFSFKNRAYSITIKYNLNSIDFYKDFPLCDLNIYFDAALTPESKESILNALKPQLSGLSAAYAVDFLLNFVQKGFPYKTDQEQFNGEEKYFFPEEDLYYQYSDCDDRAVFFAYLVKELLGFKVIGVVYPGHIATAVRFPSEEAGDFVTYKGEKYLIADPTYINAPFGCTMPGLANAKAGIIELANERSKDDILTSVWEKVKAGGGQKGDIRQNYCIDGEGNYYVTGYFREKAIFGGATLTSANGKNDAFLAKFNPDGNPVWALAGGSEGNSMGYNVAIDQKGNLYVSGIFEKNISFGRIMTLGDTNLTVYVAKFNGDGRLIWLNQVSQDTTGMTGDYIFSSTFTDAGQSLSSRRYPPDANFNGWGISFDASDNVYYTGSYTGTVGMKTEYITLNLETDFDVIVSLKEENDKQVASKCEKTISGLISAFALIRLNNIAISGREIQQAFEKYNPGFKADAPIIFERIGKLKIMKNDEGIVTVLTEEGKQVVFDQLKIMNNTKLKVKTLANGDTRIDILSGLKVGKGVWWYDLNFMRLFRTNGNIQFDYSKDHSQKILNLKKDILM